MLEIILKDFLEDVICSFSNSINKLSKEAFVPLSVKDVSKERGYVTLPHLYAKDKLYFPLVKEEIGLKLEQVEGGSLRDFVQLESGLIIPKKISIDAGLVGTEFNFPEETYLHHPHHFEFL